MSLEGKIRIIPHLVGSASMNLSIDRALLQSVDENPEQNPIIRIYTLSRPAVIFGCQQRIVGRLNSQVASEIGVDITQRDTGGGHMYFGKEDVHFSFVAPTLLFPRGNVIANYRTVNDIVRNALSKLGYDVHLGRTSLRVSSPDGKIIAGNAQRYSRNAMLHQGGILCSEYDSEIFKLLMARENEIAAWEERVSFLKLLNPVALQETIATFVPHYLESLKREELQRAREWNERKYGNRASFGGNKDYGICLVADYTKDKIPEMAA